MMKVAKMVLYAFHVPNVFLMTSLVKHGFSAQNVEVGGDIQFAMETALLLTAVPVTLA
jgi:hypothetical protein